MGGRKTSSVSDVLRTFLIPDTYSSPPPSALKRRVVLLLACLHGVVAVLLIRLSRVDTRVPYMTSVVVMYTEILKLIINSIIALIYTRGKITVRKTLPKEFAFMSIVAITFVTQNNLNIFSMSYLSGALFHVVFQMKIVVTAIMSVFLLRRTFSIQRCVAITLLTIGVSCVSIRSVVGQDTITYSTINGIIMVLFASFCSGTGGCLLELFFKNTDMNIFVQNGLLAVPSLLFNCLYCYWFDGAEIATRGFFVGFTPLIWIVIMSQAMGGFLVCAAIKYADNILKCYASGISLVLISLISWMASDHSLNIEFCCGAALVMFSVYLYNRPEATTLGPESVRVWPDEEERLLEDFEPVERRKKKRLSCRLCRNRRCTRESCKSFD